MIEKGADNDFDGPIDAHGQPKVDNEDLDIEVRFSNEGPTMYRWFWDGPTSVTCGAWRDSRQQAYREGQNFLTTGKTYA